jgi:toxin-antitoxin system PIN domain toxin
VADAILVDANLLLWAHHRRFPQHEAAHEWWARALGEVPLVGIPWPTSLAFLRISTHARVLERPLDTGEAWTVVKEWLGRPNVRIPVPTERHPEILGELLVGARATANHTTDAHLAALALEWGLELQSADADFARYRDLRWRNPVAT